jgi:tRNA/tmRNA/rRNA uracil-C5-methylase (TrmA/RlmC/RlmD family)
MQIEVVAEKWVNDGFCIGYDNGKTVFILGAIPGEKVICEIYEENSKYLKGKTLSVLHPSENRRIPPCPVYLECGGCNFQHIEYTEEREVKVNLLFNGLFFHGLLKNSEFQKESISIKFNNEYGYRNNVQLKIKNNLKGFYKPKSNDIVPLPKTGCLLLGSELNNYILNKNNTIPEDGKLRYCSTGIKKYKKEISKFIIKNKEIIIPEDGFFQINQFLIENWIDDILNLSGQNENIIELFCGAGTLSIFLADIHNNLKGYEVSAKSIEFCKKNSVIHNLKNTSYEKKDLYQNTLSQNKKDDFICIANPPRAGLGKIMKKFLLESIPKKIIYSSCNYTTLLPDLKDLNEKYEIKAINIYDFFPRTPYFETLVLLERKK